MENQRQKPYQYWFVIMMALLPFALLLFAPFLFRYSALIDNYFLLNDLLSRSKTIFVLLYRLSLLLAILFLTYCYYKKIFTIYKSIISHEFRMEDIDKSVNIITGINHDTEIKKSNTEPEGSLPNNNSGNNDSGKPSAMGRNDGKQGDDEEPRKLENNQNHSRSEIIQAIRVQAALSLIGVNENRYITQSINEHILKKSELNNAIEQIYASGKGVNDDQVKDLLLSKLLSEYIGDNDNTVRTLQNIGNILEAKMKIGFLSGKKELNEPDHFFTRK